MIYYYGYSILWWFEFYDELLILKIIYRNRTHNVYKIFSRKPVSEVYKTLQSMKVNYVILERNWCFGKRRWDFNLLWVISKPIISESTNCFWLKMYKIIFSCSYVICFCYALKLRIIFHYFFTNHVKTVFILLTTYCFLSFTKS